MSEQDDKQLQLADFECICGLKTQVPFDAEDGTITIPAHECLSVEQMKEKTASAEVGVFRYVY